ncbi:uroporphyrinogen-III synthase [Ascidiimonas aurantiaca]|uniref:uroporphyrinogen-III synthase n=1 Tax=Ascidiimonas aurantiaca TaxID=1685432 RepID=UPI0030ED7146
MSIARVFSTKKLSLAQKELLLNANVALSEADFIQTEPVPFPRPEFVENAIFTSQNAVKQVSLQLIPVQHVFCVGDKTRELALASGFNVIEHAYDAKSLANLLIKKHASKHFIFFCGETRRDELPDMLNEHTVSLEEIPVYRTRETPKQISGKFDGVLFFSPSAVRSFIQKNTLKQEMAFCIGKTTEQEVKKHTNTFRTATRPTVENVIVQVVKHFSKND